MRCAAVRFPPALLAVGALLGGCASEPPGAPAPAFTNPTPAEHTQRFFPIATGVHGVGCEECHGSTDTFTRVDCTGCHPQAEAAPFHVDVGGFQFLASGTETSSLCLRCHDDSQVHRIADHLPWILTPPPLDPGHKHYGASCLVCHPSPRADKPFTTDFTHRDCSPCHGRPEADAIHAGMAGYSYDTQVCLTCHANGGI